MGLRVARSQTLKGGVAVNEKSHLSNLELESGRISFLYKTQMLQFLTEVCVYVCVKNTAIMIMYNFMVQSK